jgi:Mn2+/Fe2+ NRAMP family transporter
MNFRHLASSSDDRSRSTTKIALILTVVAVLVVLALLVHRFGAIQGSSSKMSRDELEKATAFYSQALALPMAFDAHTE